MTHRKKRSLIKPAIIASPPVARLPTPPPVTSHILNTESKERKIQKNTPSRVTSERHSTPAVGLTRSYSDQPSTSSQSNGHRNVLKKNTTPCVLMEHPPTPTGVTGARFKSRPTPANIISQAMTPGTMSSAPGMSRGSNSTEDNFRLKVLMKLDTVIENQEEELSLLRRLITSEGRATVEDAEDIVPAIMATEEDVAALCTKLNDKVYRRKLSHYLSMLGGASVGHAIRRMMRKLGTNALWSKYSLKGRKGKLSLSALPLFPLFVKAYMKNHPKAQSLDVEDAISETLKYAPKQRGGPKFKASRRQNTTSPVNVAFGDSNSDVDMEDEEAERV